MDKNYDDGLVHSHNWACGPETGEQPEAAAEIAAAPAASARQEEHPFDDGLVHCHDWARSC